MADEHLPAPLCLRCKPQIVAVDQGGWISGSCLLDDGSPGSATAAAMMLRWPSRRITYDAGHSTWNAERHQRSAVRVLVAYRASELAAKIEAAEEEN